MTRRIPRTALRAIGLDRAGLVGGVVATLIGAGLLATSLAVAPARTMAGYLAISVAATTTALGALLLLAIVHVMDARWPVPLRRWIEVVAGSLPALALAFVPVLVFADASFPWRGAVGPEQRAWLEVRGSYLALGPFVARAAGVWLCWIALTLALVRASVRQDRERGVGASDLRRRQRRISAAALPVVVFTGTLAVFDWVMARACGWTSSVFGLELLAGGFVAGVSAAIVLLARADRRGRMQGLVGPSHYHALGRVLLAALVVWAYLAFFQLFLIWIANRPDEVAWYLDRVGGGWGIVAGILVVGRFVVPFVLLLSRRVKSSRVAITGVAAWSLAMHAIDLLWKVVPSDPDALVVHVGDLGALLLVGGVSTVWTCWRVAPWAIAPRHDPALAEGTRYHGV